MMNNQRDGIWTVVEPAGPEVVGCVVDGHDWDYDTDGDRYSRHCRNCGLTEIRPTSDLSAQGK